MPVYEVSPLGRPIDFNPGSVEAEVLQNVATILATTRFSAPYARTLGLNPEYLDDPMPVARARAMADIIEAINRNEPRCKVIDVTFTEDGAEGILRPRVRVQVIGGS